MKSLTIQNQCTPDITGVPNLFLDRYMPRANGEFVKIYLYLLRALSSSEGSCTLSSIADALDCRENDVERALRYWEKEQVLLLALDGDDTITGLTLLPLYNETEKTIEPAPASKESRTPSSREYRVTPDKLKELKQNEEIVQLLFIAEQYMGKTLSATDISRILYFFEVLHFSTDLIEYLIEYCVSKGSRSTRYMEKVALAWAESGISTVEMAKQESNTFHKHYFTILKALGVSNRNPVASETELMDRWLQEFGFTMDIILEACSRTVTQTGKPSFQYVDSILNSWHKNGVKSLSDIGELDRKHRQKRQKPQDQGSARTTNKFNNFHQRNYNYSELERQLLKK